MKRENFSDGGGKEKPDGFLESFWMDLVSTCFSHDANKLCVSVDLTFLSALFLLFSCLLVVCQRSRCRGEINKENIIIVYSFLGNLCGTVGAILSKQLHVLVFIGAVASMIDAVNCIMCCLPVFLCWNSTTQRKQRMMTRRRRQHLMTVCVLMVVAGGFLKSQSDAPSMRPAGGRRLQRVFLEGSSWSPLMDQNKILGYVLGLLSFTILCTSRFPALCRAKRGQNLSRTYILSKLLCSLSGALFAAAIFLHDTQFKFLMQVMPWLLSSIGCAFLDLLILIFTCCKRAARQQSMRFYPDRVRLLGDPDIHGDDPVVIKEARNQQMASSAKLKKDARKMTDMGHYMDVSVPPAIKSKSLKMMMSPDNTENGPLHQMVRVIRVDNLCSSDTSYDSSSSDLEVWDFGAAVLQWSKPASKPLEGDEFPLQDWPTNPKPLNICMQALPEPQKKTFSTNEVGSVIS